MRDLTDASPAAIAAERARVPREGIGAEILVRQGSVGLWRRADAPVWLPTLFTLLLLRSTADHSEPAVESAVARAWRRACGGTIIRAVGTCVDRNSAWSPPTCPFRSRGAATKMHKLRKGADQLALPALRFFAAGALTRRDSSRNWIRGGSL